jgi:hypothetical protein
LLKYNVNLSIVMCKTIQSMREFILGRVGDVTSRAI